MENTMKNNGERTTENKLDLQKRRAIMWSKFLVILGVVAFLSFVVTTYMKYPMLDDGQMPTLDHNEWWGPMMMTKGKKDDRTIRPFKIEFTDEMIHDLRERLLHHRQFTPPVEHSGMTNGFNSHYLSEVIQYWYHEYKFKERERHLNKYQHFKTNIQGLDIHFMRINPKNINGSKITNEQVLPLLMLHAWPASIVEFFPTISLLTTPQPGYDFVFELIIPSLPGFGFSEFSTRFNFSTAHIAVIMNNLMLRLGHEMYFIHAGGMGPSVGAMIATLYPNNVLGYHTSYPVLRHQPMYKDLINYGNWMMVSAFKWLWADYSEGTVIPMEPEIDSCTPMYFAKPDTIGIALTDSPAGLVAYILEQFSLMTNPLNVKAIDGKLKDKYHLTHLLDNVMIYWVSSTITTSMRVYKEAVTSPLKIRFDSIYTYVPTCGIKFLYDHYTSDSILRMKYRNYLETTFVKDGGHFPAMELPEILTKDIFSATAKFIKYNEQKRIYSSAGLEPIKQPIINEPKTVYDFTVKDIYGDIVKLDKYRGKVLIIVNVASECGLTDVNYKQLNELNKKYYNRGLRILAFPCNQFGGQEPGIPKQIIEFAQKMEVSFEIFDKVEVNGDDAHPLWTFLKKTQSGTFGDFIKWNFSKFIVDKNGVPVERFGPNVSPLELEPYLAKYF